MATTIQIKRSTGSSAPSSLAAGELAVTFGTGTVSNLGDRLFIGDGSNVDVIGGKFFSDMLDHTQGTLTASSALTVDGNKALDDLNIGNNASTGGSMQFKEGTNNGTHHVQLKAPNSLSGNVELTLPNADGSNTNVLRTNGSGTLSFGAVATSELSGTITNAQLAGSIANGKLANSTITIGSDSQALGTTITDLNGITSLDVDNITVDGNTISTTNTNGDLVLDPNGTLASAFANGQTVDGITLATNDRILLKNQSTGSENGIYTVNASGAPTRATDFDSNSEVTGGTFFFVEEGTVNADNGFVLTNDGAITVGTTALTFTQFSGAGQVVAGDALTKSGNTLNVAVDDSSIEVSSDALRVKASGITNAMLAGSIDLTAKVTGALPVGNGGTGLATIAKGSVLVANSANTLSALDGGGSNDGILTYTASSDTIAFATAVDGGTFS